MPRKRHKPEEIVAKLRQVDVLVSKGQSVADAVRAIGQAVLVAVSITETLLN
jgi:putative transposase